MQVLQFMIMNRLRHQERRSRPIKNQADALERLLRNNPRLDAEQAQELELLVSLEDAIHQLWYEDTELLVDQYEARENLSYFIPYERFLNDSHCSTIFALERQTFRFSSDGTMTS